MSGQSMNFHSMTDLDPNVVDHMNAYLQEKETRLADQIFDSIRSASEQGTFQPSLPTLPGVHLKLSDAIEGLTKKIRSLDRQQLIESVGQKGEGLIEDLNTILWEFTEVLEGFVRELFQQMKQVNIENWHRSLAQVAKSIKDILVHYIDDLIWVIRRLEGPLKEYREKLGLQRTDWRLWFKRETPQLDPELLKHLNQTEEFLKTQYDAFNDRYNEYLRLSMKVEDHLEKMKTYPVLALLDIEDQNRYVDIFRLLKIWELNNQPRSGLSLDTIRSLKHLCSVTSAIKVFRVYYYFLKDAFFNSSLELKSFDVQDDEMLSKLKDKIRDYYQELKHLIAVMTQYREFMLQTNPNPYARSRWGFGRPVAPEPPKARHLMNLIYSAEELQRWYERFIQSLNKERLFQSKDIKDLKLHQEIDRLLHEMSQPLISQQMMRSRAEQLLDCIQECDEVGSPYFDTIYYVEDTFAKALRMDWKYHVLHEFPQFHELYGIHQGLRAPIDDPAHAFRLERFFRLFDQIENWVKKRDVYAHVHEIELDINDMKAYLQDFLATIQRASKEKSSDPFFDETIDRFRAELLEYRYVFGQFFLNITFKNTEGQQLRNQFLFVDQYFESMENLLNDLQASWEGK